MRPAIGRRGGLGRGAAVARSGNVLQTASSACQDTRLQHRVRHDVRHPGRQYAARRANHFPCVHSGGGFECKYETQGKNTKHQSRVAAAGVTATHLSHLSLLSAGLPHCDLPQEAVVGVNNYGKK